MPAATAPLVEAARTAPGLSLATLLQTCPAIGVDAVYALVARGGLYVDLWASPLKEHAQVRLYADQPTAEVHAAVMVSRMRCSS